MRTVALPVEVVSKVGQRPLADVQLSLTGRAVTTAEAHEPHAAQSDSLGQCKFNLPPGEWEIVARSPFGELGHAAAFLDGGDGARVRVELLEVTTVRGMVRSSDGLPLPGVQVSSLWWRGAASEELFTDAAGLFEDRRWVVGSGTTLDFTKPGYGVGLSTLLVREDRTWTLMDDMDDLQWQTGEPFIEMTLEKHKSVRGWLLTEAGIPLPGATVTAAGYVFVGRIGSPDNGSAITEADGAFLIDELSFGATHLISSVVDQQGSVTRWAPAGLADQDLGMLRLRADRTITGSVVDSRSVPVGGVEIELVVDNNPPPVLPGRDPEENAILARREHEAWTAADGSFRLPCPASSTANLRMLMGGSRTELSLALDLGAANLDLGEFRLDVELSHATGVLLDALGSPVVHRELTLKSNTLRTLARLSTNAEGQFTFSVMPRYEEGLSIMLDAIDKTWAQRWVLDDLTGPIALRLNPGQGESVPPVLRDG